MPLVVDGLPMVPPWRQSLWPPLTVEMLFMTTVLLQKPILSKAFKLLLQSCSSLPQNHCTWRYL